MRKLVTIRTVFDPLSGFRYVQQLVDAGLTVKYDGSFDSTYQLGSCHQEGFELGNDDLQLSFSTDDLVICVGPIGSLERVRIVRATDSNLASPTPGQEGAMRSLTDIGNTVRTGLVYDEAGLDRLRAFDQIDYVQVRFGHVSTPASDTSMEQSGYVIELDIIINDDTDFVLTPPMLSGVAEGLMGFTESVMYGESIDVQDANDTVSRHVHGFPTLNVHLADGGTRALENIIDIYSDVIATPLPAVETSTVVDDSANMGYYMNGILAMSALVNGLNNDDPDVIGLDETNSEGGA